MQSILGTKVLLDCRLYQEPWFSRLQSILGTRVLEDSVEYTLNQGSPRLQSMLGTRVLYALEYTRNQGSLYCRVYLETGFSQTISLEYTRTEVLLDLRVYQEPGFSQTVDYTRNQGYPRLEQTRNQGSPRTLEYTRNQGSLDCRLYQEPGFSILYSILGTRLQKISSLENLKRVFFFIRLKSLKIMSMGGGGSQPRYQFLFTQTLRISKL